MTRGTAERDETEQPVIDQLKAMGWRHVHGPDLSKAAPDGDERAYSDLLLLKRLRAAVQRVNRLPGGGGAWMTDTDADAAIDDLRRTARNVATTSLVAVNGEVTSRLIKGTPVTGDEEHHHGSTVHAQLIDWDLEGLDDAEILKRNDFLVVNQLRVRTFDGAEIVLDLVLFVNGVPLVVIECKGPDVKDAVGEAIRDLRGYAGVPIDDDDACDRRDPRSQVPEFFAPVQLLVAAAGEHAALEGLRQRAAGGTAG
ncbi:MAG: hypothetical protein JF597_38645 [Streptomyces sp.]|uniref:type I restriction endonuclease n=1 Tax=Streptomyces sp. TaxID=1931 RepID=UPI0025F83368|nr:type I restriction endonuclease [Streptomyces sp.]MBW8799278.1 hypothetical protein [Streptomyces sp.]